MSSDINYGRIGILCRDLGFLPLLTSGYRSVEIKLDHAHQRKGNQNYASVLVQILKGWHNETIDEVVVVGDGEGDIRFCINFDNLPNHILAPKKVSGLFIRHPPLEKSTTGNANITLYESWEELSASLESLLRNLMQNDGTLNRTIVFVDVDRTILFPRMKSDDNYFAVRLEGLTDYILKFRRAVSTLDFGEQINSFAKFVSANSTEYTDEFNDLCFKNEEVVAVVTLLLSIGTVIERWIGPLDARPLSWMLRHSIQKVRDGGWISGLESAQSGGKDYIAGESIWSSDRLLEHLQSVLANLSSSKPVLCAEFRGSESERLNEFIVKHGHNAFNLPLLGVIRSAMPLAVLFVTDRPAQSLGFVPHELDNRLGAGAFWSRLRTYLLGEA